MTTSSQINQTSTTDPAAETTHAVLQRLFGGQEPDFEVRLWNGQRLPAPAGVEARFSLVLTHPGAMRRLLVPPGELTLAEAYLRGDFDIQGDIHAAMELAAAFERLPGRVWSTLIRLALTLPNSQPPDIYVSGRQRARLRGSKHSRARDREAVTYHYDTGNEFYRLFLGKWMTYSSAYFPHKEAGLDAAQAAKLEHICRKLRLKPGERLLDIGCGWGALALYAARHYGVQVLGVTLSEPQVAYGNAWLASEGLAGKAHLEVRDYRDLAHEEPFDKIVSVGMFEHVGREKLPEYFRSAWKVLRPGGLFLNHGIATHLRKTPNWFERTFLQRGQFIQKYVFPDGELVPVSDALVIAEGIGFEVRDLESLREHYALTLRHWVRNLEANHAEAVRLKDERTYRTWRLYMAASAYGFENNTISVYQALLSKDKDGRAGVPLTRADLYRP